MNSFQKVKHLLLDLDHSITRDNPSEGILVINDESEGIKDMVIDCNEPLLIMEQFIVTLKNDISASDYLRLLQLNRELVHGAFVIDESGKSLLFRNTLQLEHLYPNELEASINAFSLAISENSEFLLEISTSTVNQKVTI